MCSYSVADPGFPRGGRANPSAWGKNPLLGKIFAENCMKIKDIGPGGGDLSVPLGSANIIHSRNLLGLMRVVWEIFLPYQFSELDKAQNIHFTFRSIFVQ